MPHLWFRRMGDIPGVGYEPPVPIDRTHLAHHDAVPEVEGRDSEGRLNKYLRWKYENPGDEFASTSQSPASAQVFRSTEVGGLSSGEILQSLWATLELPGEPSDYHHAIQNAVGNLFQWRIDQPELLAWVEWLSWLDIRLVRSLPDTVYYDDPDRSGYYSVAAFHSLIELYQREGFLHEALQVAQIAEEFHQGVTFRTQIEERIEFLRAEDAD